MRRTRSMKSRVSLLEPAVPNRRAIGSASIPRSWTGCRPLVIERVGGVLPDLGTDAVDARPRDLDAVLRRRERRVCAFRVDRLATRIADPDLFTHGMEPTHRRSAVNACRQPVDWLVAE